MKVLANYKNVGNAVINGGKAMWEKIKSFCKKHSALGIYVIGFFIAPLYAIAFFGSLSDTDSEILLLYVTVLGSIIIFLNAINSIKEPMWEKIKSFCKKHSELVIYVIAFFAVLLNLIALFVWKFDTNSKILWLCVAVLSGIIILISDRIEKPRWKKIKSFCKKHFVLGVYIIAFFIVLFDLIVFFDEIYIRLEWIFDLDDKTLLLYATALVGVIVFFIWMAHAPTFPIILSVIALIILTIPLIIVIFDLPLSQKISNLLDTDRRNEAIRFISFGMGGVIGAIFAASVIRRAAAQEHNNELIRKGNDDVRFQNIVSNLGDDRAAVRITAFYRFFYLAEKEQDDDEKTDKFRKDVFEILCACLRTISSGTPDSSGTLDSHGTSNALKNEHEYKIERQALVDILFKGKFKDRTKKEENLIPPRFVVNLHGAHLAELDLSSTNISDANLSDVNLSNANLSDVNFSNANLSNANLSDTNLSNANLSGADLLGVNISDANLSGVNFSDVNLSRANLSDVNLRHADLSNANLSNAKLLRTNLSHAILSNANLSRAKLLTAKLIHSNLSNANLSFADFNFANLSGADLSDANFLRTDLSNTNLRRANLSGTNLWGTNLSGTNLADANLAGVSLAGKNLSDTNLSGANLSGADLSGADLSNADLSDANLSGADLSDSRVFLSNKGANCRNAKLKSEQLQDVLSFNGADFRGTGIKRADLPSGKGTPITDE